jgi:signal transduction histidine kinase
MSAWPIAGSPLEDPEERPSMTTGWDDERPRRRRRHRRRRGDSAAAAASAAPAPPAAAAAGRGARPRPTPEERALRDARRAANRKIGFLAHAVPYGILCVFLLLVAGFRPALIVATAWGIALALHYFLAIVAPELRQRLVEREVSRRVQEGVSEERRTLEGRHAQHVEELSASIAHEIRNPITAAKSLVQQMGEDPRATENVEYAKVALEELERVERSISHLLRFARDEDLELRELRLADVVDSALDTLRERIGDVGACVERDVAEAGSLRGDAEKLRRVVINLVGNALDALEDAGTPAPRLVVQGGRNLAGTEVWLRVRDNGPGIEAERLERIWSPFYTSKRGGTGLGLPLARKVVDAHGGSLEVRSAPGAGTEFVLTLPRAAGREGAA